MARTAGEGEEDELVIAPENDDFPEVKPKSPPATRTQLERELHNTQKSAYAAGTLRNFLCQWRSYLRFAQKYRIIEWPISEHTICLFAQYLAYSFKSHAAIRNYLNGLKTLHVLARVTPPDLKNSEVVLTLRGLGKTMGKKVKQAQPLTPEILTDILAYLNMERTADRIFWAMLLVGFFGMLRKSNLMPDTKKSFDPLKQLTRGHIIIRPNLAIIKVTWAKNIQNRERVVEIPLFPIPGSPLCPVTSLRTLLKQKGKKHYPLFGRGKKVAFTYVQFQNKFRRVLKKAGYKSELFSSHSMRRGSVGWCYRCGVPESLIQVRGGWASDSFKRYLSFPLEVRAIVSLKMREKILKLGF